VWASWSDGGAISHTVTTPSTATTYTANFTTQFQLTTAANPGAGGTISPATGWYTSGSVVAVSATAGTGYTFAGFTGALTGSTTPQNLTMNAAKAVTAQFNLSGGPPWYSSGGTWIHRKSLTVDRTQVSGSASLSNFPLLVAVTDPDLRTAANGGSVGNATGTDILFTAGDGMTKLAHELESYNASTGQLVAWVRIPSLSPQTDTVIYTYYGNAGAADQQNRAGVWDANYKGVWHLSAPSGTAVSDSTSNANNGTKTSATVPAPAAGKLGGAQSFNGSTGLITVPDSNSLDMTSSVTISAWINASSWPNSYGDAIVNKEGNYGLRSGDVASTQFDLLWWNGAGGIRIARTVPPSTGTWHHVVGQASANDAYRIYVDGVLVTSAPTDWYPDPRDLSKALRIGGVDWDLPRTYTFHGLIDEVRVSDIARSADWIMTEFRNQNSPATFYTVGPQE
jgi:hypothetical protein